MLPTLVVGLANQTVVDVAASETHTAALTVDGELYTWGRDRFGQVRCVFLCPSHCHPMLTSNEWFDSMCFMLKHR